MIISSFFVYISLLWNKFYSGDLIKVLNIKFSPQNTSDGNKRKEGERMSRVFANGLGDLSSIPGWVISKTQKMVLDAALLNTQHYNVKIKGK